MERPRLHARRRQSIAKTHPMQNARRVGTDLDAGPQLGQRVRLLVDVHVDSHFEKRKRGSKTADPCADDRQ